MNEPPLKDKVAAWLSEHGYPLEMKVARALHQAGFSVVQSEYFDDPETGKPRETDVVAYEQSFGAEHQVIFALIAECKSERAKPWVLFTETNAYPPELTVTRTATSASGQKLLPAISHNAQIRDLSLFRLPERSGYSLACAFTKPKDKDLAYDGLMSVTKAAKGCLSRMERSGRNKLLPFAFPYLVVDAPLFEVFLGENAEPAIQEIQSGLLIWRNPVSATHSLVHIFTFDAFSQSATQLREDAKAFTDAVIAEIVRKEGSATKNPTR